MALALLGSAGAYAFYDRWSDVFDTLTEPTIATLTRGLAATAFLMARTPAAAQPWRAARGSTRTTPAVSSVSASRVWTLATPP